MDDAPAAGRHMDDLPDEILTHILNLLPIKQVMRCAIVAKRWQDACRRIIRTRGSLSVWNSVSARPASPDDGPPMLTDRNSYRPADDTMREWGWFRERPSRLMDGITLPHKSHKSLVSAMTKCLNRMEKMRRLCVETRDPYQRDIMNIIMVRKFAEQLTLLEVCSGISMLGADAFPHLTRLLCDVFDPKPSASFPKLAELIIRELKNETEKLPNMRLPCLKKLMIMSFTRDAALVREFILANAANLTVLKMTGIPLRLVRAVMFPNLIRLDCYELDVVAGCSFPALTHLTVAWAVTAESLTRLPPDQILSLEVGFRRERKQMVSTISKMENLKSL